MPTVSLTLEYDLKWAKIKLGAWVFTLVGGTSGESGGHSGVLPFTGFNLQF